MRAARAAPPARSPRQQRIVAVERRVDGETLYVVAVEEQAERVRALVGSAALTAPRLAALRSLGYRVQVVAPDAAERARRRADRQTERGDASERIDTRASRIDEHLLQHVVFVRQFTRTFPTSNVWVLHDGDEAMLIDAGYGDERSVTARIEYLQREMPALRFRYIAITHHHFDHSSGARRLREALRAETAINPVDEELLHAPATGNEDLPDERELAERVRVWQQEARETPIDIPLADGAELRVGGLTVRAVHTPGHTAGHNCYWVPQTGTLFTGDNVLGVGTSAIGPPPRGDMEQYLQSLLRMRELQSQLMAPGHGPVVRATDAKIGELIEHRRARDRQIIALVERGYTSDRQIRRSLYPEIQAGLRRSAQGQVRSHLARLAGQGVVRVETGEREWTVALTR